MISPHQHLVQDCQTQKVLEKIILGNTVDYENVCRLQPGKYVQVHQEDEPRNTIDIDRIVGAISQGPQYNLQWGYFFETILTVKRLRRSHWTAVNINEDVIEQYDTFNTRDCPEDLIFDDFNDQPVPSTYSDLTNDYDDDGTQIDADLTDNKGLEDAVVPNDENNDEDSLASDINDPKTIFRKLKEWTEWEMKLKKGNLKEWTLKLKEWTQVPFLQYDHQ